MVIILHVVHPDFSHIKHHLLTSREVPSMDALITHLIHVPVPQTQEVLA